jgi:hypothetical protein
LIIGNNSQELIEGVRLVLQGADESEPEFIDMDIL